MSARKVFPRRSLGEALADVLTRHSFGGDRSRAYDGQAHTMNGERGKKLVTRRTYRDVGDALARALADDPQLARVRFDHTAVVQCALVHLERDQEPS